MNRERRSGRACVECPVCRSLNECDSERTDPFRDVERDTDFRPLQTPPYGNGNGHGHPLALGIVTCPSCFYTRELDSRHRDWHDDAEVTRHRRAPLRQAHLEALENPGGVVRRLGEHLDRHRYPLPSAINQLLLAIVDERLTRPSAGLNLARFHLRIGWLWRELRASETRVRSGRPSSRDLLRQLRWQAAEWRRWMETSRQLVVELAGQHGDHPPPEPDLQTVDRQVRSLLTRWHDVTALRDRSQRDASGTATYFSWTDYPAFLASLRDSWPDIPMSEAEAMTAALQHYVHFFEEERCFASPEQEVQTAYLIGELARRTWQQELALRYFDCAVRLGRQQTHASQTDPQRTRYLQKLVEMSIEQSQQVERTEGTIP